MPAVNSGRSVIESPPRSSNEYISLETTSVVSPIVRANTAVGSITGTSTRLKPYSRRTRSNAATTACEAVGLFSKQALRAPDGLNRRHCTRA